MLSDTAQREHSPRLAKSQHSDSVSHLEDAETNYHRLGGGQCKEADERL